MACKPFFLVLGVLRNEVNAVKKMDCAFGHVQSVEMVAEVDNSADELNRLLLTGNAYRETIVH